VLHSVGSNNPLGIEAGKTVDFSPTFINKDLKAAVCTLIFLSVLLALHPNELGHPDNLIPANGSVTPEHIVPE